VGGTPLDRLRTALLDRGIERAVLSHPETVAHLTGFSLPLEDWPVANPFVVDPPLLILGPHGDELVAADFYSAHAAGCSVPFTGYRSYDFRRAPDPGAELRRALGALHLGAGTVGIEAASLPTMVADAVRAGGSELVDVTDVVLRSRRIKGEPEIGAIRRASKLCDVVQQAIKDHAAPGISEAELAGLAQAAMYAEAERRVPAILTVTAGAATATGGAEPTGRLVEDGDLVLTDTSPWIHGAWSDTANAVVVGVPDADQRRVFDAVRRALDLAIGSCRPGEVARDIDSTVRAALEDWGPTYGHHTGHGIGAAWSEEPRITPYNAMRIEEGMVLAVEPAVYREGWGGIRLEHVFVVRESGNEILTEFDHTL
jgi:Xaa-Pro dipeptidase